MKRTLALLLVTIMVAACFVACDDVAPPTSAPVATDAPQTPTPTEAPPTTGPDGREFADEQVYRTLYSSEVTTMNYLSTGSTYDLVVGANTIDSLVENDPYGNIVPCAAESWEVSEDGKVWTFHLRQGQYWYDADGNQKDPVTAHDYVEAARYVCDSEMECSNSYLMDTWIENATERLEYTAAKLAAVEQGTETGEDQNYVIDAAGLLYEGTKLDETTNKYVSSWDEDAGKYTEWTLYPEVKAEDVGVVAVDDYTLEYHLVKPRPYFLTVLQFGTYWPAPAALLTELGKNFGLDNYSMWFNGAYLLSTYAPNEKRIYTRNENNWDAEHVYIERIEQTCNTESTTLSPEMFLRGEVDYADIGSDIVADWLADPEKSLMLTTSRVVGDYSYFFGFNFEPKFDEAYEPANWIIAVNNENFRKTIFHAINRANYVAARFPGDAPELHLINTVTPRGFAISTSGKDFVTYGDLAAFNSTESFNEALALEYKTKALAELTAAGATFPIKIPINYNATSTNWGNASVVLEQQLENLLGADFIDVIVVTYSGNAFLNETRRNGNFALQELNWGADYMDPETWSDPFEDENSYNFLTPLSDTYRVFQNTKTPENLAMVEEYFRLVELAKAETSDIEKRYELFAAAEAYYIEHAIVVPTFISGGTYCATKLNAFEGQFAMMGQASSRYKGQHLYKTAMTQEMFDEQYEAWFAAIGN
ncbi:MAG: Oligopeptide-binding protein AmiA precursor [Firmicutes bacterium ADurb.Bin248]|nr:MAG: Oligopeptide-binding protein AmiA precursor [Firmicutes bacterium ADurb.Bin248]